jgi:hypothetical protein
MKWSEQETADSPRFSDSYGLDKPGGRSHD